MNKRKRYYSMLSGDTDKLFTWKTAVFAAIGLAINIILANIVIKLGLPLYIDNVGSILVGTLGGPIPGMTVGFLSNAINSVGDSITMYYGILTIVIAMLSSYYAQKGYFRKFKGLLIIIGSFALIGGGIGSVMTWYLYGGGIGGIGAPLANKLHSLGISEFFSQFMADFVIDIPDKVITVILVCGFQRIITKIAPHAFPLSDCFNGKRKWQKNDDKEETFFKNNTVKTLIMKMIISCSAMIIVATTLVSYSVYCKVSDNHNERLSYLIELLSVSFALTLIICSITLWVATKRIAEPLNRIVQQSRDFTEYPSEKWLESDFWKEKLDVSTGDEIEELYHTICSEQETVARNVIRMKETEEQLRHSKELEDALENARQASQAKGLFLSRMSHEIRTPLNAVIGYMNIAKDSVGQPDKMIHCIENSELAANHLLNIINDVLDISSIESGKMKIAKEQFSLEEQITTITTLFYHQACEKNVVFDTIIQDLRYLEVIGDALRMNQILMNLLSNAVKFTSENGNVTFEVTQLNETEDKIFLKFVISDTGIGMSEEYMGRLFKPFEQESSSTAQKYGGTGLGLSITANLVSMMGGAIDVKSKQGEGTSFTVTLPFEKCKDLENNREHVECGNIHALVLESGNNQGNYVKKILKQCGVKCDVITDGDKVVHQLRKREGTDYAYRMCIIDWDLKEISPKDIVQSIRKEISNDILIVAMAYDLPEMESEAREVNIDEIIKKPIFQNTISKLLADNFSTHKKNINEEHVKASFANLKVLLVEDNEMNREIAEDILKKAGVIVNSVENGLQAVEYFKSAPDDIQVILMDVQMPVMDGYEATRQIRKLSIKQAATVPIIAMTANAFQEDVSAALACGMNEHISKPINYDKLFRVLNKIQNQ